MPKKARRTKLEQLALDKRAGELAQLKARVRDLVECGCDAFDVARLLKITLAKARAHVRAFVPATSADARKATALRNLERLRGALRPRAEYLWSRSVKNARGVVVNSDDIKMLQLAVKVEDQILKIHGDYAPKKIEVNSGDTKRFVFEIPDNGRDPMVTELNKS